MVSKLHYINWGWNLVPFTVANTLFLAPTQHIENEKEQVDDIQVQVDCSRDVFVVPDQAVNANAKTTS